MSKRMGRSAMFIGSFYSLERNRRGPLSPAQRKVSELSILGEQASFFVSDKAAAAIRGVTDRFAGAVQHEADRRAGNRPAAASMSDTWRDYRAELESAKSLLRRHLAADK